MPKEPITEEEQPERATPPSPPKKVAVVANANVVNGLGHLAVGGRYVLADNDETRAQVAVGLLSLVE